LSLASEDRGSISSSSSSISSPSSSSSISISGFLDDSSPSEALDITGNVIVSGNLTVDANLIKTDSTSNFVGINTTNPTAALDVTGDVKQSGVVLNSDGAVSNPSISFTNDTNTGLYRIGSDKIGIATNGTKVGEIGSGYGGFIGNVIQCQFGSTSTPANTTSTTFQSTGLSVSITPKYSNSKILIFGNVSGVFSSGNFVSLRMVRDGSQIYYIQDLQSSARNSTVGFSYVDSPSTVSAITYLIQYRAYASGTAYINDYGVTYCLSTIIALEVQQ